MLELAEESGDADIERELATEVVKFEQAID